MSRACSAKQQQPPGQGQRPSRIHPMVPTAEFLVLLHCRAVGAHPATDKKRTQVQGWRGDIFLSFTWRRTEGQQQLRCSITKQSKMSQVWGLNIAGMETIEKVLKYSLKEERGIHSPMWVLPNIVLPQSISYPSSKGGYGLAGHTSTLSAECINSSKLWKKTGLQSPQKSVQESMSVSL